MAETSTIAKITGTTDFLTALHGNFSFQDFTRLNAAGGKYSAVDLLNAVYMLNASRGVVDAARATGLVAGILTMEAGKVLYPEDRALEVAAKAGRVATAHYVWGTSDRTPTADKAAVQAGNEVAEVIKARDFRDAEQRALAATAALATGVSAILNKALPSVPQNLDDPPSLYVTGMSTQTKATIAAGVVLGAGVLWVLTRKRDKR